MDQQQEKFQQGFSEKEQSLEDMVRTQQEKIEAEYEQKHTRIFDEQEQVFSQFD